MDRPHNKRLRHGRFSEQGRLYLLTTTVADRVPIFREMCLARLVIVQFRQVQDEGLANSLAWVVMPDHIHWLIELRQTSLNTLMQRFKSRSARLVNAAGGRQGRLWQPGFHDRALRREDDILEVARYIVANPLRAGLVQRLGDYPHWDAVWL
ncbi:transposase [Pseudomonas sp. Irchel 3E13]|uniref:REP-associated tyrosine transposase n=1 Tax=Pseudomonas sp. Irchel 3E13 TaxID=2008975 RepID=UPI000BA3D2D1|nr:transposase [Pseudomonas sp. Irchel 3E13]